MKDFNDWCKKLGVASLCDYDNPKIKRWIEKRENWDSVMWINYQKAYSKSYRTDFRTGNQRGE